MNTIAKTLIAIAPAPVGFAQAVAADSVVRMHASDTAGFERFLPALPLDIPWLTTDRRVTPTGAVLVQEAPSLSTWMLAPTPAKAWSARSVQSAGAAPSVAGM